jgi:hypothetical protein
MAVSFIGGGNRSTLRKPQTCHKSLTNFITYCCIEYTSQRTGFELTTTLGVPTVKNKNQSKKSNNKQTNKQTNKQVTNKQKG